MIHLINVLPVSNVRLFLLQTALFDVELSTQAQIQVFSVLKVANEEGVAHQNLRNLRHLRHLQKAARAQLQQAARAQKVVVAQVAGGTVPAFLKRLTEVVLQVLHPGLLCIGVHTAGGAYLPHITFIEIETTTMTMMI